MGKYDDWVMCPQCAEYTVPPEVAAFMEQVKEASGTAGETDLEALAKRLIDYAVEKFWEAAPYKAVRFRDRDGDEGYYFYKP